MGFDAKGKGKNAVVAADGVTCTGYKSDLSWVALVDTPPLRLNSGVRSFSVRFMPGGGVGMHRGGRP